MCEILILRIYCGRRNDCCWCERSERSGRSGSGSSSLALTNESENESGNAKIFASSYFLENETSIFSILFCLISRNGKNERSGRISTTFSSPSTIFCSFLVFSTSTSSISWILSFSGSGGSAISIFSFLFLEIFFSSHNGKEKESVMVMVMVWFFVLSILGGNRSFDRWETAYLVFCMEPREFQSLIERLFLQNICCLFQNAFLFGLYL